MKLKIKVIKVGAGSKLMLCDEAGEPLPCQVDVDMSCSLDFGDTITVKFRVDGDRLELAEHT